MAQEQQSQFRTVPKIFRLSLVLALSASTRDCKYGLSMDILQFGGNALFCLLFPGSGHHTSAKIHCRDYGSKPPVETTA
jgi:hypothetical protein